MHRDIVQRAQRGEASARAAVLASLGPQVASLVRRLARPPDLEDLIQGALTHLLEVLPQFKVDGPAQLSTWAFTVVHRWLLQQRRRPALAVVPLDDATDASDPSPGPFAQAANRALHAELERALRRLPDEQRRVFVLASIYEQPLALIAEAEQVPLGTVKSRLHRARAALVLELDEALLAPGGRHAAR